MACIRFGNFKKRADREALVSAPEALASVIADKPPRSRTVRPRLRLPRGA